MKHLRSIFRPQLRARSPGQEHHRGRGARCPLLRCHGQCQGSPCSASVLLGSEGARICLSPVLDVELSSCLVSPVTTCPQNPCSVSPEVFWLLCCVSCSAPSTEGQCFPKVKSSSHCWPQVWDHGSGCREQPPSCAGPRLHHWEGRWEHSCHLPPPCSSGADPALPVAPTQQGSSTTHQWGCSPSSGHSGF